MLRKTIFWLVFFFVIFLIVLAFSIENLNRTPRELAPYIERRASGHNSVIVSAGDWLAQILRNADRMDALPKLLPALKLGAQTAAHPIALNATIAGRSVIVSSSEQARIAIANANPGDVITFSPGTYQFSGSNVSVTRSGKVDAPIQVRADVPGSVSLKFSLSEGFYVLAPYWTFENLSVQGNCTVQSDCEHAFHVVGNAHHFVARNNVITDFNAHFKINGAGRQTPDDGIIEFNSITNASVRRTESSVTLIDLVAASRWRIEHNMVSDFVKAGSDKVSYGVFVKGGGHDNHIVNNLVICEHHLRGEPGQRVGLSLGGGGTGKAFCADRRCVTEQDRGVIEGNLVLACSDDGIYLNKAAASKITKNTLIDTGGIEVRFAESTADVEGNLVDGKIRTRDGGLMRLRDNIDTNMLSLFAGYHPVRNLFENPATMNFQWRHMPSIVSLSDLKSSDLCASANQHQTVIGAFEDFSACLLTEANARR